MDLHLEIEEALLLLCANVELPARDNNTIREFCEHREYGLAYEELCSAIGQDNLSISVNDYETIERIGRMLEMNSHHWQDIKRLIRSPI